MNFFLKTDNVKRSISIRSKEDQIALPLPCFNKQHTKRYAA